MITKCNNTLYIVFLIVLINILLDIFKNKITRIVSSHNTKHTFCKHKKHPNEKYNVSAKNAFTSLESVSNTQNLLLSNSDGTNLSTKSLKDIYDAIAWARQDAKNYAQNYTDGEKRKIDASIATKAASSWVTSQLGTKINENTANSIFLYKNTAYKLSSTNTDTPACLTTDKEDLQIGGDHDATRWMKKGWRDSKCVTVKLF